MGQNFINNILLYLTFITSSICFIDLVRNKKQYKSMMIFILMILFGLFLRKILIFSDFFIKHLLVKMYVVLASVLIVKYLLIFFKHKNNVKKLKDVLYSYSFFGRESIILILCLILLNIVTDVRVLHNNEFYFTFQGIIQKIKCCRTDGDFYSLIFQEKLKCFIIYLYILIEKFYTIRSCVLLLKVSETSRDNYDSLYKCYAYYKASLYKKILIAFTMSLISMAMTPVINFMFKEISYFLP